MARTCLDPGTHPRKDRLRISLAKTPTLIAILVLAGMLLIPPRPLTSACARAANPPDTPNVNANAQPEENPLPLPLLRLTDRAIARDQGRWTADYRFAVQSAEDVRIAPAEVIGRIEAYVSNSRVPGMEIPRRSVLEFRGDRSLAATATILEAADESKRCQERCRVSFWVESGPGQAVPPPAANTPNPARGHGSRNGKPPGMSRREESSASFRIIPVVAAKAEQPPAGNGGSGFSTSRNRNEPVNPPMAGPLVLPPNSQLRIHLEWDHSRFLYGPYDPLMGERRLTLQLGSWTFADTLPLVSSKRPPAPRCPLETPPPDRLDPTRFVSSPHSLHLEAHIPGNQYYRYKDQEVRYSTPMRLSFWYLVAEGTMGKCKARVSQYRDGPSSSWKVLSDGGFELCFETVGSWVYVEKTFRTEAEATTLGLDFRIVGADIGEVWVDDVQLVPCDVAPNQP